MSESDETIRVLESSGDFSEEDNEHCSSSGSNGSDTKKTCVDCGTSKTPLWRGGPAGPKSLCNACGIKSRKKRQAGNGITREEKKKNRIRRNNNLVSSSLDRPNKNDDNRMKKRNGSRDRKEKREAGNVNYHRGEERGAVGCKVPVMKRTVEEKKKKMWRRKLGEEEQAAFLLMALSCAASVYA